MPMTKWLEIAFAKIVFERKHKNTRNFDCSNELRVDSMAATGFFQFIASFSCVSFPGVNGVTAYHPRNF
jgi:hypothetical protein